MLFAEDKLECCIATSDLIVYKGFGSTVHGFMRDVWLTCSWLAK